MDSLLSVRRVSKSFPAGRGRVEVLRGVDMEVPRGKIWAVLGASGSGKSTLLSLMAGLDRPTSGEIFLDGKNLTGLLEKDLAALRREKVGFVFQAFHLVPSLTVLENVCLPQAFREGVFSDGKGRELLGKVGLEHRADFFPEQISGGEKQRAAVARALINDPLVIFADEPTGNLDSANGRNVLDLLESHTRAAGRTLVLVTHDIDVAARADEKIYLKDGALDVSRRE